MQAIWVYSPKYELFYPAVKEKTPMFWLGGLFISLMSIGLYAKISSQFGGSITTALKNVYARSKHWDGEKFNNLSRTVMDINFSTLPGLLKAQFTDRHLRSPQKPLEVLPFVPETFAAEPEKPKFVWYGHSVLLLQINGKNLLIDPMFGENASPIAPFATKRFSENTLDIIDQLPHIDAVLMTHDHYDHLDYASFEKIRTKTDTFLVALGVGRHLESWGIPAEQITEFDWWQETEFQGIQITFTPSRHFSGRGLFDRAKSLWGGWVFQTATQRIYWSGDGGYDTHFKEVGEKYGPFDWAFVECGQYNPNWHQIHMYPEEAVQALEDVGARVGIPVHWGGFALALHSWKDPVERFVAEADRKGIAVCTPRIGEIVSLGIDPAPKDWWVKLT